MLCVAQATKTWYTKYFLGLRKKMLLKKNFRGRKTLGVAAIVH